MIYIIIPPYALLALYIILKLVKNQKTEKRKIILGLFFTFLFFLPLTWDVILGRTYFYYLCSTQGGIHVYEPVKLSAKYFDNNGNPMFINKRGGFEENVLEGKYKFLTISERKFSKFSNIAKYTHRLVNATNEKIYGEKVSFVYFGGWFINATGFPVNGERCHGYSRGEKGGLYHDFLQHVFYQ